MSDAFQRDAFQAFVQEGALQVDSSLQNASASFSGNSDLVARATIAKPASASFNAVTAETAWDNYRVLLGPIGPDGSTTIFDETPSRRPISVLGDAQVDTGVTLFGGPTLVFDGTSDRVQYTSVFAVASGTVDATIEAWVYLTSTGAKRVIFGKGGVSSEFELYVSSTEQVVLITADASGNCATATTSAGTIAVSTWHHVAAVRVSGAWNIYIDGTSQATATDARPPATLSNGVVIGSSVTGTNAWVGNIAEARIIYGYAVYTGNFTAPTARFPRPEIAFNSAATKLSSAAARGAGTGGLGASATVLSGGVVWQGEAGLDGFGDLIVSGNRYLSFGPDGDIADGSWTTDLGGSDLWTAVDELVASDTDYIRSSDNPVSDTCQMSLANPAASVGEDVVIEYRYAKEGTAQIDLIVTLKQGATTIATWTHTDIAGTYITASQILSPVEVASITDYDNLSIELTAQAA